MVGPPDKVVFTIKPKPMPVTYLYLQPTSIFISYNNTCIFAEKQSLNIVVSHSSYHKKPIRMGLVISSILVTGDEDELILFWNKEKVRKYSISVNMGEVVGKQLVIVGFDNRIRLYDVHHENGVQKSHVFVGHTMGIYNISSLDDGIFTTSSYDGTTRWWNAQAKNCFSYFNVNKKLFRLKNTFPTIKYSVLICQSFQPMKKNTQNLIVKEAPWFSSTIAKLLCLTPWERKWNGNWNWVKMLWRCFGQTTRTHSQL